MNFKSIKSNFSDILVNMPGWHTYRKIVVIESDDWGSIRMPSKEVYDQLINVIIKSGNYHYWKYDTLASEDDLSALFEVLFSVKDKNNNPAIITANTIVANPDFKKIKEGGYKAYYYEPFTETLKRYPHHAKSFELWKQGMENHVWKPQFHGREHLNVKRWISSLQNPSNATRMAFDLNLFGLSTIIINEKKTFWVPFDSSGEEDNHLHQEIITEGLDLFKNIFNYTSLSFIAPNYNWYGDLEYHLFRLGVKYIQGLKRNLYKIRYIGQRNKSGMISLIRNSFFEPSESDIDIVDNCLNDIKRAFRMRKPAIISSHRVNFIGEIVKANRDKNLILLERLLKRVVKYWPNVEFMSSDQLGELISSK